MIDVLSLPGKVSAIIASLIALLYVLDTFLPIQSVPDKLIRKEAIHRVSNTSRHSTGSHNVYFQTSSFNFEVDMQLFNALDEGETIMIFHSPVFKLIHKVSYMESNKVLTWTNPTWRPWTNFALVIFIEFSAFVALSRRYDTTTSFNASIAAVVAGGILSLLIIP